MLEVGRDRDLGQEALGSDDSGQLGLQDLDRDLAVMAKVLREIDGRHAAFAELVLHPIAVGQRRHQPAGEIVQTHRRENHQRAVLAARPTRFTEGAVCSSLEKKPVTTSR